MSKRQHMKLGTAKQKKTYLKALFISGGLLMFIALALYIAYDNRFFPFNSSDIPDKQGRKISTEKTPYEKQVEQNLKDNPSSKTDSGVDKPEAPSTDKSIGKQEAHVMITGVDVTNGRVNARGFATNVVEAGGTCSFIFTQGNKVITKQTATLPSTTSTSCKTAEFSLSELSDGVWMVTLEYTSTISYGKSDAVELKI